MTWCQARLEPELSSWRGRDEGRQSQETGLARASGHLHPSPSAALPGQPTTSACPLAVWPCGSRHSSWLRCGLCEWTLKQRTLESLQHAQVSFPGSRGLAERWRRGGDVWGLCVEVRVWIEFTCRNGKPLHPEPIAVQTRRNCGSSWHSHCQVY